jgi:GT2 family glycosyltransferase
MILTQSKPQATTILRDRGRGHRQRAIPRLSVVIVNYCQWENTAALTTQLLKSRVMQRGDGEIVVVDNHSPAHPLARRLRRCRGVSLRRWGRNRGFARGVNEGCRLSDGDWVLLLNPDMTLPESFLDYVIALTEQFGCEQPRAGIIGLGLCNTNGSRQLSAGTFPTFLGTLGRLLLPRARRKYHSFPADRHSQVDWVTGCGMLIRRDCLRQLGGLDANFFLYYEDVDLCRRARANGWQVWYIPEIQAIHHSPLHQRRVNPALRVVTRCSLLTYARKHWPRWQTKVLTRLVQFEAWARQLWANCRGEREAAQHFSTLAHLTRQLANDRAGSARHGLRRLTQAQHLQ